MTPRTRRSLILLVLLLAAALLILLLVRCSPRRTPPAPQPAAAAPVAKPSAPTALPATEPAAKAAEEPERLGPATIETAPRILAGAKFEVRWTGPNNSHDYVALVPPDAKPEQYLVYAYTKEGSPVSLTAPIAAGSYAVRYVTSRSKTVLAQQPVEVFAAAATLDAPAEVVAGTPVKIAWTGPNNQGDYVTVVPKTLPDGRYGNYERTNKGSPLDVLAPIEVGDAEIRYMTGQGDKVLARRALRIVGAEVTLSAPEEVLAGRPVKVTWTGPKNQGDYITVVPKSLPDGRYGNYERTNKGSPLDVLAPMEVGDAEIRYMAGQGDKVLGRRALRITAPEVTLAGPAEVVAGTQVSIDWTGPKNGGDYITIVPKTLPDGRYGNHTAVNKGSPLEILVPMEPGAHEIRYMSGQGSKVLARRPIQVVAAQVTLDGPAEAAAGSEIQVTWTGPNNGGDYITVVSQGAGEGTYRAYTYTKAGSPLRVKVRLEPGSAEIRYVAGQGNKTLARKTLHVTAAK